MINDFLNLPTFLLCLISVSVSAGLSIAGLLFIRQKFSYKFFKDNHEVSGFLFNALGLIYAVLVAFVVYSTWTDYDDAKHNADQEANQVHQLFLLSRGLPEEYHNPISETLIKYTSSVLNVEWQLLSIGEFDQKSKETLIDLWHLYMKINTLQNSEQSIVYTESLKRLVDLTDFRRLRILSSQDHTPGIIWTVIIIGALTSIGFSLFFGGKSLMIQAIMTGLFAMTNALILLLILVLDHPYSGDVKISSEAFEYVLGYITNYMTKM